MQQQPELPPLGERARAYLRGALFDNLGLKFVSLVLALTVFILVNTGQEREIVARVGVSYTLPDDKVLVSERVDAVRITVRGPWNRIRHFDERELDRINLDLTHTQAGEVAITPDMIELPAGLTLTSITPKVVRVAFERVRTKGVQIEPVYAGRAMHGFRVDETETKKTLPPVTARGPEGVISALSSIRTEEIRLDGRSESFSVEVQLVPPDGVEVAPDRVTVPVSLEEIMVNRRVGPVRIALTGDVDPSRVKIEPAEVEVVLAGGLRGVERVVASGLTAQVAVSASDVAKPHTAPVVVEGLPPGVAVQVVPAQVMVMPRR
ncbi:MAG TPA: CdaR family protein [Kofleriaceae bacterium]|nr:CdaR family protein [Kofleriaceae bacterium]